MTIAENYPTGRPTKPCEAPGCHALITRPPHRSDRDWDNRKYCSRACVGRAAAVRNATARAKPCARPECDQTVTVRAHDYCSQSCASRARRAPASTQTKVCALDDCDAVITRPKGIGKVKWDERKYCTSAHGSAARRREGPYVRKSSTGRTRVSTPRVRSSLPAVGAPARLIPPAPERPVWRPDWLRDYGNGLSRVAQQPPQEECA